MIQANIVELQRDNGWEPSFILIGPPEEFQAFLDKVSEHDSGIIHDTRWRRLKSTEEAIEYAERGCQIRTKGWEPGDPIDWS